MRFFILVKMIARVSIFLMFFAVDPWFFIVVVFLNALFELAGSPAYAGIMKEIYPDSFRGRAMGYVRSEQAISAVFASYIGGILLDRISYRYIFPLATIAGILSLLYFGRIKIKDENRKVENIKKQKLGLFPFEAIDIFKKDRLFSLYCLIFFAYGFGSLIAMPLYPIFLVDVFHASNTFIGKLGSLSSFFWIISYIFWGRFVDRRGEINSFTFSFMLSSLIPLLYSVSFNIWFIVLASIISGFNIGTEVIRINYITKITKPENVQTYQGIDFSLMGLRGITAPFIGVKLMNLIGIRETLFVSFSIIFVAFFLMCWFNFRYLRKKKICQ